MLYSGEISWDVFEFIVGFAQEVYTKRRDYTAANKDTGLELSLIMIDIALLMFLRFLFIILSFTFMHLAQVYLVTLLSMYIH